MSQSAPWSFRLELHVIEDVVHGHHSGIRPLLRNLWIDALGRLQRGGLIPQAFAKLFNPRTVASDLRKLEIHRSGGQVKALSNGLSKLGVDFNGRHRLSFRLRQVTLP